MRTMWRCLMLAAVSLFSQTALAADYPAPQEADWFAPGFRFHTGDVVAALRLHYTTIGDPDGAPVLILHGTTQSGRAMLTPAFAGELFGPGQALDAAKYFIILPDAIGAGQSARPSDGTAGTVSALQLRRHGSRPVPAGDRGTAPSVICGWSSATRWAACTPGYGA